MIKRIMVRRIRIRSPFCVRSCQDLSFLFFLQDLKKPGSQLFYKISQLLQTGSQPVSQPGSHAQPVSQARISRKDSISRSQYLTVQYLTDPVSHGPSISRSSISRPSISRSQYLTFQYLTVPVSHGSSISRAQYLTGPVSHGSSISRTQYLTGPVSHGPSISRSSISRTHSISPQYLTTLQYLTPVSHASRISAFL